MNPAKSGWLKEFVEYRKATFELEAEQKKLKLGKHPDQSIYGMVQPTGIMYGCPVGRYDIPGEYQWTDEGRLKVLLVDSLINIAELYAEQPIETAEDLEELAIKTLESITEFYNGVYSEISVSLRNWLGQKKNQFATAEHAINKRVALSQDKNKFFWSSFFSRSQLFLDIYIFGQWSHTKPDSVLLEFFKSEKEELSFTSVKVMAAAAHANKKIEEEERIVFEHFITTTGLSVEKKRVAKEYFEHGMGIQEIPVSDSDPWVIRKFFLEMAVLTIWADKRMEDSELEFLSEFNECLGFNSDDLDVSLLAVEGFLLQNWSALNALQSKIDYSSVSDEYIDRMVKLTSAHHNRIESMVIDDAVMMNTIRKGQSNDLSDAEKQLIREKFFTILKSLPNIGFLMLPDSFLTYEYMLRVIPKDTITKILSQD